MSDQIKEPEIKNEKESNPDIDNIDRKHDDLECSKKIGEYILFDEIGKGTFSKVVRAFHLITQQTVAVKILEKDKIEDEVDIERIIREIEILKNIHHPNIAQMYETYSTVHNFYIMLEYVSGGDLFDYITCNNFLSEKESCYFFRQIISVLEYLMEMGISHRDIKPENVLLNENHTEIKLIDFGLSNYCSQNELLHSSCGSPCYASPEMLSGNSYSGNTTDLWSAGIILYSMLVGALPFDDQEINKLYEQIKIGKFYIPSTLSLEAIDLLKKILEVDPKKRINIEGIKNHSWFKLEENPMYKGINISIEHFPCDIKVVNYVIKNYFKDEEDISPNIFVKMIHSHECNKYTATYYLVKNNILKIKEKFKIRKEKNKDINKFDKENNNQNDEDDGKNSNAKQLISEKNEEIKNGPNDNKKSDNKLNLIVKKEDDIKLKNETEEDDKKFCDNDKNHKKETTQNKHISNDINQKINVKITLNENFKSNSKQKNDSKIKINEKENKKSNKKNIKELRTEKFDIPILNIEKYNENKFEKNCITEKPINNIKKSQIQSNNNKNSNNGKNKKIISERNNINQIFVKNTSNSLKKNKTNSFESKVKNLNKMNTLVNKDGQNKNEILRMITFDNNKNTFNKIKITSKSNKNYKFSNLPTETNLLSTNGVIKDNNKNDNDNKKQNYQLNNNNNKFNEIVLFNNKIKFRNANRNLSKYRTKNNINDKNSNTYINKNLLSLDNNITNFGYTINLNIQNNNIFNNQDNNFNIKQTKKNNKKKKLNIIPNHNKPTNIYNAFNNVNSRNKSHLRNYKTALKHLFTDLRLINKINNNDFLMPKIINISRNKKSSFSKDNNSATISNFPNKNKSITNNNNIKRNANQLLTNNTHYHSGSHDENKNNFSLSPKFISKIKNEKDKKLFFINNNILKIDYQLEKKNKNNKFIVTSTIGNNIIESSRNNPQRNNFVSGFHTEVNMRHNSSNRDYDNLSAVFKNKINKNEKNNNKYAFNLKLKNKPKNYNNNLEQSKPFNNSNNYNSKNKTNFANKKSKIYDKIK